MHIRYGLRQMHRMQTRVGRPVDLPVEDSDNETSVPACTENRKQIERDKVNVTLGDVKSVIAYAMMQVADEIKVFHIVAQT